MDESGEWVVLSLLRVISTINHVTSCSVLYFRLFEALKRCCRTSHPIGSRAN